MKNGVWVLLALSVLSLAIGCGRSGETTTVLSPPMPQLADTAEPTAALDSEAVDSTPVYPSAVGEGTVSPAVSIVSITFVVNGVERVVRDGDTLQALPGDRVEVRDVTICAGPFMGDGGEACVDFAPVDKSGQEVLSEHRVTHLVRVTPGLIPIPNARLAWTVSEDWSGISAVLNHWTPEETRDLGCASGHCERDDQIMVELHSE